MRNDFFLSGDNSDGVAGEAGAAGEADGEGSVSTLGDIVLFWTLGIDVLSSTLGDAACGSVGS